jgi:hypothetical protein
MRWKRHNPRSRKGGSTGAEEDEKLELVKRQVKAWLTLSHGIVK